MVDLDGRELGVETGHDRLHGAVDGGGAMALPMVRPQNFIETGRTASVSSWKAGTISLFT